MSSQSHTFNAYESNLAGPLLAGATSVAIVSLLGIEAPAYLVIDPDNPLKREWIRVTATTTNVIDNMDRGLEGSNGPSNVGVDHDSDAPIRAIFTAQLQDDLFFDINALETFDSDHIADSNPHPVYLTEAEGDLEYLRLDGATFPSADTSWNGKRITSLGDAQADGDATNRGQVLAADAAHVAAADPHTVYVKLAGDTMTGPLDMGNSKITSLGAPTAAGDAATKQFVDDEIGSLPAPFDGLHDSLSDVTADQHHTKFTDADARAAVDNGTYLKLTGGTVTGNLTVSGTTTLQGDVIGNVAITGNLDVDSRHRFTAGAGDQAEWQNILTGIGVIVGTSGFAPNATTALDLGASSLRWDTIFGVDLNIATINGIAIADYLN